MPADMTRENQRVPLTWTPVASIPLHDDGVSGRQITAFGSTWPTILVVYGRMVCWPEIYIFLLRLLNTNPQAAESATVAITHKRRSKIAVSPQP